VSKEGETAIAWALSALFVTLLFLFIVQGVTQGQANEECRKNGGTPVKTERGYACMKSNKN
jgi:hypothetical protein